MSKLAERLLMKSTWNGSTMVDKTGGNLINQINQMK